MPAFDDTPRLAGGGTSVPTRNRVQTSVPTYASASGLTCGDTSVFRQAVEFTPVPIYAIMVYTSVPTGGRIHPCSDIRYNSIYLCTDRR